MNAELKLFPRFPDLPTEIRLRIWQFASRLCLSRTIELSWNTKARSIISRTRPPPLLHTSRESRFEMIQRYTTLQFDNCTQVILVDFETDIVFFGSDCKSLVPGGKTNPGVAQNKKVIRDIRDSLKLQRHLRLVAFDCSFLRAMDSTDPTNSLMGILRAMKNLERIILVTSIGEGLPAETL
jgi:hypothetical protein